MTGLLSQHWQILLLTLKRIFRTPFASLLTILVMGIALSLPAGLYVLLENVERLGGNMEGAPQISLFLMRDIKPDEIGQLETQLQRHPEVRELRFIPRDQALREISRNTGLEDITSSLEQNPLPDAFVIHTRDTSPETLEALRQEFQQWPKVEIAQLDSDWAKRLYALLELGRRAVLILALLLSFALVAITGNTIRLHILTQREEIEVSKLIGATDHFIRLPFLYYGALQGLAGGATAWLIIGLSIHALNGSVARLASLYGGSFSLGTLNGGDSLSLLLFSGWLGWLGAYLAVSQHLRRLGRPA